MPEENIPDPIEGAETQVTDEVTTESQTNEFDVDKVDNLSQIRTYAKGLKADIDKYKPASEFISSKFGSEANAQLAADFYGGFAGDEFDPDKFLEVIGQLSPSRAKQLTEKLSKAEASQLANAEVESLFGGKVSKEEIALYKKWKESGYNLGEGEDIPEALKVDAEGNPKSPEEIQFLRDLQRQIKETNQRDRDKETSEAQQVEFDRQTKVNDEINSFSTDRLNVLDSELDAHGLKYTETDSADERAEKDFIKAFIMDGIAGAFMKNVEASKDYNSAVKHIQDGEALLARRYEPRIEAKLLEIARSKGVGRLLKSLVSAAPDPEVTPEINTTGSSTQDSKPTGRISADDIAKDLVSRGLLKL